MELPTDFLSLGRGSVSYTLISLFDYIVGCNAKNSTSPNSV